MAIAPLAVPPGIAAGRYAAVDAAPSASAPSASAPGGFGDALSRALQGAVDSGDAAESLATRGVAGQASVTDVVTAVSKAELALQTTTAVRDRVVQAYQDIMRMPI